MTDQTPNTDERMGWVEPDARWIEPEILELDVSDTFYFPNRGGDGFSYPDCTLS